MNRVMFVFSLVGLCLFAWLLAMTLVWPSVLKDFARDYINRRIEPKITRSVAVIEREILPTLDHSPDLARKVTSEIAAYRQEPIAYIDAITSGRRMQEKPKDGLLTHSVQVAKGALAKTASITEIITEHFREVFAHLVLDLRIFATSNLVGFAVVAWLTHALHQESRRLQIQAFILFVATGYASSVYIKQDWFFNLLLDHHMGIGYPLLIIATCYDLWVRWRRGKFRAKIKSLTADMILR